MQIRIHLLLNFTMVLFFFNGSFCQSTKFAETSEKIENLLRYKEKSPNQLRELLSELNKHKAGNESDYELLKTRVDQYLLPLDIKLARSDVYNKKYRDAVNKLNDIKLNYTYNKNIEQLEGYLDRKLFVSKKRALLKTKSNWFSVEPSFAFYTAEMPIKSIKDIRNVNQVYGLGLYVKLNNTLKYSTNRKTVFKYSQIGIKIDYRDPNYLYLKDTIPVNISPYFNTQVSFIYRKSLGLDAGIMSFSNKIGQVNNYYSFTGSIYIPMNYISLGIHTRIITDFMSTNPLFQMGTSLKVNLGIYKPFRARDKEEISAQIIKFKEGN